MSLTAARGDDLKHLERLIIGLRVAMLTTISQDGTLQSRPIVTQNMPFAGTLWFCTRLGASDDGEMRQQTLVNVNYSDPRELCHVSISGRADLVKDRETIEEIWNPNFDDWFPNGFELPKIALVRVNAIRAEFWDAGFYAKIQFDATN
jgi:general stress protein 26